MRTYIGNLAELAIEDHMDYGGKFAGVWFFLVNYMSE